MATSTKTVANVIAAEVSPVKDAAIAADAKAAKYDPAIVSAVAAINESIANTPLSIKLANMLSAAKHGSDRYRIVGRQTPVLSGVLAVYSTEVFDSKEAVTHQVIATKPIAGGRAVVLGRMTPNGVDLCPQVKLNADILAAVGRANSAWAEALKADTKQKRLDARLDAIAAYFEADNGAFVDL